MADKENQFQSVVESLLKGMDTVLSTKTVVGEATQVGDTIILPLVDVSFGVGAGAGSRTDNGQRASGAGGLGGKMTPSAVLVIKDGQTKLVTRPKEKGGEENEMSDAEVVDIAFPEEEVNPED